MQIQRPLPIQFVYDIEAYECARDGISPVADLEWFATDVDGHAAVFSDAGTTWIPDRFFEGYDRYARLFRALADLPVIGQACVETCAEEWYQSSTAEAWASRGFYYYDWPLSEFPNPRPNQPYRLICRPSVALDISALDAESMNYMEMMKMPNLRFGEAISILIDRRA